MVTGSENLGGAPESTRHETLALTDVGLSANSGQAPTGNPPNTNNTDTPTTDDDDVPPVVEPVVVTLPLPTNESNESGSGVNDNLAPADQRQFVYRVNAGGGALSGNWISDTAARVYAADGSNWQNTQSINRNGVDNSVPLAVFQTERWHDNSAQPFIWQFPVTPGNYQVNLYFAEIWSGAMHTGGRVFDVRVDNQQLDRLDVYDKVGGFTALQETFLVTADNDIHIELTGIVQNPSIKGIEIIALQGGEAIPLVEEPQQPVTPVSPVSASDNAVSETETVSAPIDVPTGPSNATQTNGIHYRVNAGGATLSDADANWVSDQNARSYAPDGSVWSHPNPIQRGNVDTHVPLGLFQSERWQAPSEGPMRWEFPVTPGTYQVTLYFAELWDGAMQVGGRVFDVAIEGAAIPNVDVYAEVGGFHALQKQLVIESDNLLEIVLTGVVQNPSIKGIEIRSIVGDPVIDTASDNQAGNSASQPMVAALVNQMSLVETNNGANALLPIVPPTQQCEATGSSLDIAKQNYAASCSLPRADCDPLASGGWVCSSSAI